MCENSAVFFGYRLVEKIPVSCCTPIDTAEIAIQQQKPKMIGFAPLFISFTMFVLSPIAPIAIEMKNVASHFIRGTKPLL